MHMNTHTPDTYTLRGGTHSLTHTDTHSETHKETLTDSGIFKYRDTLIDRDTANRTHSTGARAESHSNTETLKYRNTLTTETHSDMRTRALSQAQGNRGAGVCGSSGAGREAVSQPEPTLPLRSPQPTSRSSLQTDVHKRFDNHLP